MALILAFLLTAFMMGTAVAKQCFYALNLHPILRPDSIRLRKRRLIHHPHSPPETLLRTYNLRKSYGSYQVLKGLNLAVRRGNIYGFLGRNGAGKTTTIQALMGIQGADSGVIEFFGQKVRRPGISQKRRIGYVSQEQFFYQWMECGYIGRFVGRFYPTWDEAWFKHLLEIFDLPPKRKIINLSQGMKVKLALALALAHRPDILILDEPTSGLDPAARREFLELVSRQAHSEERTTFFSSHIVEEVERIANRVGILEEGRLCYEGDVDTLRQSVRRIHLQKDGVQLSDDRVVDVLTDLKSDGCDILADHPDRYEFIVQGDARAWDKWDGVFPSESLSLEDIFLALTVDRVYHL